MLKNIATFLLLALSFSTAQAQESLSPDSLLNWLKIIHDDDFRTLAAVDQNGFYIAVNVDSDGDILFSKFNQDLLDRSPRGFATSITTPEGANLIDPRTKKENPASVTVGYSSPIVSTKLAFERGVIFPLNDRNAKQIRVNFIEILDSGERREIFNQLVILP